MSKSLQSKKLELIESYEEWMTSLQSAGGSRGGKLEWLHVKGSLRYLAGSRLLRPAPKYARCLEGFDKHHVSTWVWNGDSIESKPSSGAFGIPKHALHIDFTNHGRRRKRPRLIEDYSGFLSIGVQRHYKQLVKKFGWDRFKVGVAELNSRECTARWGEDVNTWSTALWFWRRCFDEAFEFGSRVARTNDHNFIYHNALWNEWTQTAGSVLWSPSDTLKCPRNAAFARWLTRIWLKRTLDETYFRFVGIACRMIANQWMNTNWLYGQLDVVGAGSMWVIENCADQPPRVHAVSTIANVDAFESLRKSGFNGSGGNYCESFERLHPLIDLLGTDRPRREKWRNHWRKIRRHDERKNLRIT